MASNLPSRAQAQLLLETHVKDTYQLLHAKMVATALEAYAAKFGEDADLWYLTGLLHDLDYFEHPNEHPRLELEWFAQWGYPQELIHAVEAHAKSILGITPSSKLAAAILSIDELAGFLYAYSLMRPEGFANISSASVKKKFKDKAFAKKIDREEIMYGVEKFSVDFDDHITFLVGVFGKMFTVDRQKS